MINIGNVLFDPEKVAYVCENPDKQGEIIVAFDGGAKLIFEGDEAREVWKFFDDKGWKE